MTTLWERAKQIIPGGNSLYSKRPERYAPNIYPTHETFCYDNIITDAATGKQYKDFASMGIGCCTLGYSNKEVEAAVTSANVRGNMSSLNPIEQLQLAEAILKINKKHDMVMFALTGGEACKIAVEVCRAFTGRKTYLAHGYNGWMLGTPERTYGLPINTIDDIQEEYDHTNGLYSCVIMEPVRNYPQESYELLKAVRKWCTDNNIPLILDEITSGFRCNIGGYHVTKDIYPDVAVYGKALGNGHPMAAITGKQEIMEAAEDTFISSTMWSERSGYAAALATLEEMKKNNVPLHLIKVGKQVQEGWKDAADIAGIDIDVRGIPPLASFEFATEHKKNVTYLTQEMLKRGYLSGAQMYASLAHKEQEVKVYLDHIEDIFIQIGEGKVKLDSDVINEPWRRVN